MDNKKLMEQILRICEKQYRKGYQQGVYHNSNGLTNNDKAHEFRKKGSLQNYKKSNCPITGRLIDRVDLISVECQMGGMDDLKLLINKIK